MPVLAVRRSPKNLVQERRRRSGSDQRISWSGDDGREISLPSNHECNSSLERTGYDNEIGRLERSPVGWRWAPLYAPPEGGYVGEVDPDWDGHSLLFTRSTPNGWEVCEIGADGTGVRTVSRLPHEVHAFDPCWLPDGRIVFGATATFQSVPCWHGLKRVCVLYRMNADGSGLRQLCFDQTTTSTPPSSRTDRSCTAAGNTPASTTYSLRLLTAMNPDGTGQRALYGSNSWFPNALYFPREMPGAPGRIAAILSGYRGPHRMGWLAVEDTRLGAAEGGGIPRISGCGQPVERRIADNPSSAAPGRGSLLRDRWTRPRCRSR